jgi:hypothetical protein
LVLVVLVVLEHTLEVIMEYLVVHQYLILLLPLVVVEVGEQDKANQLLEQPKLGTHQLPLEVVEAVVELAVKVVVVPQVRVPQIRELQVVLAVQDFPHQF